MDIVAQAWQWLQTTVAGIWLWFTQLPWGVWLGSLMAMTMVEWVGFLASIAALIAFVIGIPRLRSFQYTQRDRVFVKLFQINEQLISRLLAGDGVSAKAHREALRDYIFANSFEFNQKDNVWIYTQWQKANTQATTSIKLIDEKTRVTLSTLDELVELRVRLNREIQKLRKAPINMSDA
jgi:hypothetical protein